MRLSVELTDELFLFGGYATRSADVYNYDYGEYGSLDVDILRGRVRICVAGVGCVRCVRASRVRARSGGVVRQ